MAKVPFTKFKCKIDDSVKQVQFNDEITIEVKQYLPIQEKLELIGKVIMQAHEPDVNYPNPVKLRVFADLEIIFSYTNIAFTDKQKEDLAKLYDLLVSSGVLDLVLENLPEDDYLNIITDINKSAKAIYDYQNSVLGVLDTVKTDYSNTELDVNNIQDALKSEDFSLIKDIVNKLG